MGKKWLDEALKLLLININRSKERSIRISSLLRLSPNNRAAMITINHNRNPPSSLNDTTYKKNTYISFPLPKQTRNAIYNNEWKKNRKKFSDFANVNDIAVRLLAIVRIDRQAIGAIAIPWRIEIRWSGSKKDSLLSLSSLSSRDICPSFLFLGGRGRASQTDTRRGSCCCENVLLTPVDGRQILARCWCNGGSCSNGVNGGGRSSLRTFNVGSCCIGSRCDILPGERRTVNRGLRRFFWNPLQQQLQTDVSSSSDIVSPWFPTWPDSIEPFAVITSPSRRTAPCAACVIQQFSFLFSFVSSIVRHRLNTFRSVSNVVETCSRISIVSMYDSAKGWAWGSEGDREGFASGRFSCIDSRG